MPGKGKKMSPEHARKIGLKTKQAYRAVQLAVEHYRALMLRDRTTVDKTYREWKLIGKAMYEEFSR